MPLKMENLSILVAEDVQPMREIIVRILTELGVGQVYAAKNGRQAFQLFCRAEPDIVIADWHMPVEDGLELVQKIRTDPHSPNKLTPFILVTGYGSELRVGGARDKGITEYLVKPFSAEDLIKRITHVINAPRDFIDAEEYFGPDRRRRKGDFYDGDRKRETDLFEE